LGRCSLTLSNCYDTKQVALLKVYKEYVDTAWNLWKASGQPDVGSWVYGDPEALKSTLKGAQEAHKQVRSVIAIHKQ
jgi:hypothetical protein